MKNILIKSALLLTLGLVTLTSCVNEDDTDIPPIKEVLFNETFESTTAGSGANEIAIALPGWVNSAVVGSRKWHSRAFSGNKYAEFSSFYSVASTDPNDEIWLVTPSIDLTGTSNPLFSFQSKVRFFEGAVVTVYISEDFDGTEAGIGTATWTELDATLPDATQEDIFLSSGDIDLSAYSGSNVNIAFKYVGSKASGVTTTFQLDNIKINEN